MRDYIRHILNVIDNTNPNNQTMARIFLETEKGFDNLEMSFMFEVLKKMSCGANFLNSYKAFLNGKMLTKTL